VEGIGLVGSYIDLAVPRSDFALEVEQQRSAAVEHRRVVLALAWQPHQMTVVVVAEGHHRVGMGLQHIVEGEQNS